MNITFAKNDKYGSLLPRFVAGWIDSLILGLPMFISVVWIFGAGDIGLMVGRWLWLVGLVFLPMIFVSFFYSPLAISKKGQTIGQAVVGLEVLDKDEKLLSTKVALFREKIGVAISGAVLFAGFFSILTDKNHQAWHDHMAGSFVYKREDRTLIGMVAVIALLAVYGYLIYQGFNLVLSSPLMELV